MELGLVRKIDIDREMQEAYLDYAMSVIVSRALPDAREGHLEGLSNLRDEADRQEA
jgi:DNA gyrase/topoisomerase IV subunit A